MLKMPSLAVMDDMSQLDQFLSGRTFMGSHSMGVLDVEALNHIESQPQLSQQVASRTQFPHVFRWMRHCRSQPGRTETPDCALAAQVEHQQHTVLARLKKISTMAADCEARLHAAIGSSKPAAAASEPVQLESMLGAAKSFGVTLVAMWQSRSVSR